MEETIWGGNRGRLIWLLVTVRHCFEIVLGHRPGREQGSGSVSKDITRTRGDTESSNMPSNPRNHQYLFPFQAVEITLQPPPPTLKCFTLQNQCRHRGPPFVAPPLPFANGCCCSSSSSSSSRSLPVNRTIIENAFPIRSFRPFKDTRWDGVLSC